MKKDIFSKLGNNLWRVRIEKSMTINQLSKKARLDRNTLLNIEKGVANPLFSTILKLSKALNTHPSILCKGL